MNTRFRILFLFAVGIVLCTATFAQEKGFLYGNATDKYIQEPVAGASIKVEGSNEGTFTDSSGNYKLETSLGTKNITITNVGYGSQTKYDIVVSPGNAQMVNFDLLP